MTDQHTNSSQMSASVPTWFWVFAVLALLWNAMGAIAYIADVNMAPEALASMTEAQRNVYEARPAWATGAFALAVFSGLLGSVFLLLKNKLAVPLFLVSLIAVLVQNYYSFVVAKVHTIFPGASMLLPAMVVIVCAALLLISRAWIKKAWLN